MVMRANTLEAAGGSADIRAVRTRRILLAIYRGFCVMNCWCPTNIMSAIAFVASVGMNGAGWIEDRLSGARLRTRGGPRPATTESWAIYWRIVALTVLVMLMAEGTATLFGISLVAGVTLVVPLVALG
jgi:hypothetical protein